MTSKVENRRRRLRELIAKTGLVDLAKMTGKPASQLSDMAAGRKSFGEKVADAMTDRLGLHGGWFDEPGEVLMNGDGQISANYQYRAVAIAETGAEQMSPGSYSVVAEPNAKNPYNPSAATSLSVSGRKLVSRLERLEAAGAASPQMYTAIEALLTMAEQNNNQPPSAYDDIRKAIDRDD